MSAADHPAPPAGVRPPSSGGASGEKSVDQIRDILFGAQMRDYDLRFADIEQRLRSEIESLRARIDEEDSRSKALAGVLPEALTTSHGQGQELRRSLQAPVTDCLREAVQQEPQSIADALFPVMGPAIRKSIREALRSFTANLNKTIDHSFSIRSIRWRVEARRSGVPFAEVVLKNTLRFWVDEVFLIQRDTGLLIEHAAREGMSQRDNDAISAMLSAIRDFVRDAFQNRADVQEVNMGERLLWVLRGPNASLACLIRGVPDSGVRLHLNEVLEQIEFDHGSQLANFSGERDSIEELPRKLERCLIEQDLKAASHEAGKPKPWIWPALIMVLICLLGALGWFQYQSLRTAQDVRNLADKLDAMPGVVVTSVDIEDNMWTVRGLRDPLEAAAMGVMQRSGMSDENLRVIWSAYVSLEPEMVLSRARLQLQVPPAVDARLEQSILKLQGGAPLEWIESMNKADILPVGIDLIDTRKLIPYVKPGSSR